MTMVLADRFERVGRPKNSERYIEMIEGPIPSVGDYIRVEEVKRVGNRKKQSWVGTVKSITSCLVILQLDNGANEAMQKNDFKLKQLNYIELVH